MCIYLGIDWSQTHHDACWLNDRGQVLNRLTMPHTAAGLVQLDAVCQQLGVARAECWVGLEDRAYAIHRLSVGARLQPSVCHSTGGDQGGRDGAACFQPNCSVSPEGTVRPGRSHRC